LGNTKGWKKTRSREGAKEKKERVSKSGWGGGPGAQNRDYYEEDETPGGESTGRERDGARHLVREKR